MYVDIVSSNIFNLNKHFFFSLSFSYAAREYCLSSDVISKEFSASIILASILTDLVYDYSLYASSYTFVRVVCN